MKKSEAPKDILTLEDIKARLRVLAKPIDFSALEKRGIISKVGAWYRVHKFNELPEHALQNAREMVQDSKGIKFKFDNPARAEKILRKFERK